MLELNAEVSSLGSLNIHKIRIKFIKFLLQNHDLEYYHKTPQIFEYDGYMVIYFLIILVAKHEIDILHIWKREVIGNDSENNLCKTMRQAWDCKNKDTGNKGSLSKDKIEVKLIGLLVITDEKGGIKANYEHSHLDTMVTWRFSKTK